MNGTLYLYRMLELWKALIINTKSYESPASERNIMDVFSNVGILSEYWKGQSSGLVLEQC